MNFETKNGLFDILGIKNFSVQESSLKIQDHPVNDIKFKIAICENNRSSGSPFTSNLGRPLVDRKTRNPSSANLLVKQI